MTQATKTQRPAERWLRQHQDTDRDVLCRAIEYRMPVRILELPANLGTGFELRNLNGEKIATCAKRESLVAFAERHGLNLKD